MTLLLPDTTIIYPTLVQAIFGLVFVSLGLITTLCKNNINDNACQRSWKNIFYNFSIGFYAAATFLVILPTNVSLWLVNEQFSYNLTNTSGNIGDGAFYNDYTGIAYNSTININSLTSVGYGISIGVILAVFMNMHCLRKIINRKKVTLYLPNRSDDDPTVQLHNDLVGDNETTNDGTKVNQRSKFLLLTISVYTYLIFSNALLGHQLFKFHNFSTLYIAQIVVRRVPLFFVFGCFIGKEDISKASKALTSIFLILLPPLITLFTFYVDLTSNELMVFPLLISSGLSIYTSVILATSKNDVCQSLMLFGGFCMYTFVYSLTQF